MKLTPLDIHHKEFRNSLRGYNAEEVDDFLDEVADEFERLFKENIDLSEKLDSANGRVREYGELEHTLQATLVSAQKSAEEVVSRATRDAERMVRDAEAKAQEIVSAALEEKQRSQAEHARLQAAEDEFRDRFKRMLEAYLAGVAEPVVRPEAAAPVSAPVQPEAAPEVAAPAAPVVASGVTQPIEQLEVPQPGEVKSLTLGEVADSVPLVEDVPTLDVPEEFAFPRHAPVGELDDLEIEEID
jgi:cell division initiation protein